MGLDVASDPYKWPNDGSFLQRLTRPGRGMYHDVRRRLPYYLSDIRDGFNYRTLAGTIRIYFVNLLPALAFQLDMAHNTGGFFGLNEALMSSLLAAGVFSIFSVQPLTVVGITGLISLFNYTIYDIMKLHDVALYPQVMVWVGIWSGIFHWATAIFNLCDYMRTVTDFSSQTFALYVGTIYIIKGCEELSINFYNSNYLNGFASALIAVLYTLTIYFLEKLRGSTFLRPFVRQLLSDYAYPIATIFWTGFAHFPGNLAAVDFEYLPIGPAFHPTTDRPWVIDFWNLPVKWIFVAIPFGLLMTLLFYYDHNVSSLTAQARSFPLTKPAGFHWDFFLLGCTCWIAGILSIPLPNGLVPQAPVHTDALTYYSEHVNEIRTTKSIADRDRNASGVLTEKLTIADKVAEQRVSHFLMTLLLAGTMTGPLLTVLHLMPRAIFSGVFFIVGWGSIGGNEIIVKILYLLQEPRFRQPSNPLNRVRKRQIAHFVGWQLLGWAATVAISQTIAAIGFPVLIVALIPLRWVVLPRLFSGEELGILDELTATGEVVHVSLGGVPEMPEKRLERMKREKGGEYDGGEGGESGERRGSGVFDQLEEYEERKQRREREGVDEQPQQEGVMRHRRRDSLVRRATEVDGEESDDTKVGA